MTKKETLLKKIEASKARSSWDKGVKLYAYELAEQLEENELNKLIENITKLSFNQFRNELKKLLLNGANDWKNYSWGGCSLIYDCDIAVRLCNHTELVRTDNGMKAPNKNEEWLDVQARALFQAYELVYDKVVILA